MVLCMMVTFHLLAALHAVPNSEQPDPEFIPFCNAVFHHVFDGPDVYQVYNCMVTSQRSDRRMPLTIFVMEAPPMRVAGQPASIHCESNISHVWDTLWNETKGGQVTKDLLATVTGEPLEELSSNHHRYDDFPHFEGCYILPPIIFYSIPNVTVSIDSDFGLFLGNSLVLTCHVINVAPVQNLTIRWLRGDRIEGTASYHEHSIDNSNVTQFNVFDSMTVPLNKEENGEMYTCQAELNLEPYDVIRRDSSIRVPAESLLDFEQRDFNFALFCEMDPIHLRGKWRGFTMNQVYICVAASDHSSKRIYIDIYLVEDTPGQAERFAGEHFIWRFSTCD